MPTERFPRNQRISPLAGHSSKKGSLVFPAVPGTPGFFEALATERRLRQGKEHLLTAPGR